MYIYVYRSNNTFSNYIIYIHNVYMYIYVCIYIYIYIYRSNNKCSNLHLFQIYVEGAVRRQNPSWSFWEGENIL